MKPKLTAEQKRIVDLEEDNKTLKKQVNDLSRRLASIEKRANQAYHTAHEVRNRQGTLASVLDRVQGSLQTVMRILNVR